MLKENKGITLVALIITIIVMLILAAVSISLVVGENGVLTQAQSVEPAQIKASLREAIGMVSANSVADYYTDTAATFKAKTNYKSKYGILNTAENLDDAEVYLNKGTGSTTESIKSDITDQIKNNFSYSEFELKYVPITTLGANDKMDDYINSVLDGSNTNNIEPKDSIEMDAQVSQADPEPLSVWVVVMNGSVAYTDPSQEDGEQIVKIKMTLGKGPGANSYLTLKAE